MKHTKSAFLGISLCSTLFICAADPDEHSPLIYISIDYEAPVTSTAWNARSVKDVIGHITVKDRTLNAFRLQLTSLHDLPMYDHRLQLDMVTKVDVSHNNLTSNEGLYPLIRHMQHIVSLDASDNLIDTIDAIPPHARLETFLVHNNLIKQLDVQKVFSRLSQLKQVSLHYNKLIPQSITHVEGTYPTVEELFFDNTALNEKLIQKFAVAFPNLHAEIMFDSDAIQAHYSHIEEQYDWGHNSCKNPCKFSFLYILPTLVGAGLGALTAYLYALEPTSHLPRHDPQKDVIFYPLMRYYSAIFVPIGTVVVPIGIRALVRCWGYCCTHPEASYKLVYDRNIAAQPTLLNLIKLDLESPPDQEHDESRGGPGQEE